MKGPSLSPSRLLINAFYVLFVLVGAFAVSMVFGAVSGWILHTDTLAGAKGDLSHNFYVVYPIRAIVAIAAFFVALYMFSRTHGFRVAFSLRETMTTFDFLVETLPALLVYLVLIYRFLWSSLPSWYLAGALAAIFRIIDPSNIYALEFGGTGIEGSVDLGLLSVFYYLWLQILIDVAIAVVAVFILRKGRRAGEVSAQEAHDHQLSEMRRDSGLDG